METTLSATVVEFLPALPQPERLQAARAAEITQDATDLEDVLI
jgi:hypothetical protein